MFTEKQKVLAEAPGVLNKPDQPWEVTVDGDAIVAKWKWMDATFFAPNDVTNEIKEYSFTVKLNDKGKYKEIDKTVQQSSGFSMNDGKISFGSSSSSFIGKTTQKSFEFGIGKNNQTGEVGAVSFKFDTTVVKKAVREYLQANGWKKAGLFG